MSRKFTGQRGLIFPNGIVREFNSHDADFGYMGGRAAKQTFSSPAADLYADSGQYSVQIIATYRRCRSYFDKSDRQVRAKAFS